MTTVTAAELAASFRAVIADWLTYDERVAVDAANRAEPRADVCHTHDYCDANMAMLDACHLTDADENDAELWAEAWQIAAQLGFATFDPWDRLLRWIESTFPNADTVPTVLIPWGDDECSGLILDDEVDPQVRIGIYRDYSADDAEAVAMLIAPDEEAARWVIDYLTEYQPEGTDWVAWAAQRFADWDWSDFELA